MKVTYLANGLPYERELDEEQLEELRALADTDESSGRDDYKVLKVVK